MSNVIPIRKDTLHSDATAMHLLADFADMLVEVNPPDDFLYVELVVTAKELRARADDLSVRAERVEGTHERPADNQLVLLSDGHVRDVPSPVPS